MVTLKEIASVCGVSTASVSKALRYAPDIGEETANKIRETAKQMGYMPNAAARALKTNRTNNIGVLFEDDTHCGLTHEYFTVVLNSLKNRAEALGYDVTFISKNIGGHPMSYLEHCRYRGCDGVVIASVDFSDAAVHELAESDLPLVTIDYVFDGHSAVLSDNARGIRDLLEYVYAQGHRKIAFVYGDETEVTAARLAGFRQFCEEKKLIIPPEYLISARYHAPQESGLAARALLKLPDPPTCVLFPDDISILGAITEFERNGLKVPEDISVAGYDGIALSRLLRPQLTTLQQDSDTLGAEAARLLIDAIEHPEDAVPELVSVPGSLQTGGTVQLCPATNTVYKRPDSDEV